MRLSSSARCMFFAEAEDNKWDSRLKKIIGDQEKRTDAKVKAQETSMDAKFDKLQQHQEIMFFSGFIVYRGAFLGAWRTFVFQRWIRRAQFYLQRSFHGPQEMNRRLHFGDGKVWLQKCYDDFPAGYQNLVDLKATLQGANRERERKRETHALGAQSCERDPGRRLVGST